MIRVLHVVSSLGIGSGVMSVLMNYHRAIDKSRVQFDYLTFKKVDLSYEKEIQHLGGYVYYCPKPGVSHGFIKEMQKFFKNRKENHVIMHCHPIFAAFFWGYFAKKQGIKHIIQHSHTTKLGSNKKAVLRNRILLCLARNVITDYVACSEDAKKVFFWKLPEEVFLLKNAFATEKYTFSAKNREEIRHRYHINEKTKIIGHIGRFSDEKNHPFLLDLLKLLREEGNDVKLLLIGDGPNLEKIKSLSIDMGIEDAVIFAGRQIDIGRYLSAMDCFVFPSVFEGLGLVLLEAQINGLPCIASKHVPLETKITDSVVYKSLKEPLYSWTKTIKDMQRDRKLIIRAEDYNIDMAAEKLIEYYEKISLQDDK